MFSHHHVRILLESSDSSLEYRIFLWCKFLLIEETLGVFSLTAGFTNISKSMVSLNQLNLVMKFPGWDKTFCSVATCGLHQVFCPS